MIDRISRRNRVAQELDPLRPVRRPEAEAHARGHPDEDPPGKRDSGEAGAPGGSGAPAYQRWLGSAQRRHHLRERRQRQLGEVQPVTPHVPEQDHRSVGLRLDPGGRPVSGHASPRGRRQ